MRWEEYLKAIYYDPKHAGSYSSPKKLWRVVRAGGKFVVSLNKIKKWLSRQDTYTMHRPSRKRFKRNIIVVDGMDELWDMDLMDMNNVSQYNDGYRFVLVAIDVFSRYGWAIPIESKKADDVVKGLRGIFDSTTRRPATVRTDKGSEYVNAKVKHFFAKNNVHFTTTQNEVKANYVERWIKTIKGRLSRYFQENDTFDYLKILPDVVNSYNNTYHRSIKKTPASVNKGNELDLWQQLYVEPHIGKKVASKKAASKKKSIKRKKKKKPKDPLRYKIGDAVRISHLRNVFTREYDQKWTGEVFTITQRLLRNGIPVYRVKDYGGDNIKGTFYQPELQKVDFDEDKAFKIEKIVKTRGKGKKKEHLVLWKNWPKKYQSWVKSSDLESLR